MSIYASKLNALLDAFIARRSDYQTFWSRFMTLWNDEIPEGALSPAEWAAYEEVYELVYMGGEDPLSAEDIAAGLVGAAELRSRLTLLRARL